MIQLDDEEVPAIVLDTGRFVVAYKPAGMHSAPPGKRAPDGHGPSLAAWLGTRIPAAAGVRGKREGEGGMVHRLDRDTRGLVLFALDDDAFSFFEGAAATGRFKKRYRVEAEPVGFGLPGSRPLLGCPQGVAAADWAKDLRARDAGRLAERLGGRSVASRFRPYGAGARRVACGDVALVDNGSGTDKRWTERVYRSQILDARAEGCVVMARVELTGGFRHQIRAHMAWLGLPLLGDELYGEGGQPLALVAYALDVPDPDGGPDVSVERDLALMPNAKYHR